MTDFKAKFNSDANFHAKFGNTQVIETGDYERLGNKPSIEDIELVGNKTFKQLGMEALSVQDIEKILYLD